MDYHCINPLWIREKWPRMERWMEGDGIEYQSLMNQGEVATPWFVTEWKILISINPLWIREKWPRIEPSKADELYEYQSLMNQGEVATNITGRISRLVLVSIPYESGRSGHHLPVTASFKSKIVSIPYESGRSGHALLRKAEGLDLRVSIPYESGRSGH